MRINAIGFNGKTIGLPLNFEVINFSSKLKSSKNSQVKEISSAASNAVKNSIFPSISTNGVKQFQSVDEINTILGKEYGINSTLTNFDAAKLFLESVEDFVNMNEKDMFKGLKLSDGKGTNANFYDIIANPYEQGFEIEFSDKPKKKSLVRKANLDFINGNTSSDNPKYMFYMLLGRYLYFKQNSEKDMYSSVKDFVPPHVFLRIGSNAGEDCSSYIANYIATKMCNVSTTKIMDDVYEMLEGPVLNLPKNSELKSIKGIQHSFKSTKEAHDYLKKYKIQAVFPTVAIANLAVGAIEDYIKVNNNKKMFQGLQIVYDTTLNCWLGGTLPTLKKGIISFNTAATDWKNADVSAQRSYDNNFHSSNNPKKTFYHELAHWLHYKNNPENYIFLNSISKNMSKIPLEDSSEVPSIYNLRKKLAKVSNYGATNPHEFVAEYVTARMNGQAYPEHINNLFKMFYNGLVNEVDSNGKKTVKFANGKVPLKFPPVQ